MPGRAKAPKLNEKAENTDNSDSCVSHHTMRVVMTHMSKEVFIVRGASN